MQVSIAKVLLPTSLLLTMLSCAQTPLSSQRAPTSAPATKLELYTEYPESGEEEEFKALGVETNSIQDMLRAKHKMDHDKRGFHAKSLACLKGTMQILDERPNDAKFGVFAEDGKSWPIWVRFSNGNGFVQADHMPDARGLAIKVMGVNSSKYGPKFLSDEQSTQDFLMTNSPLGFGGNAKEFVAFGKANAGGTLSLLEFASTRPKILQLLITRVLTHIVTSVQTEQYWSGSPYHLGPANERAKAIKYTATPCAQNHDMPVEHLQEKAASIGSSKEHTFDFLKDPNYLRDELQRHAKASETCFILSVQFQKDPYKQPIEDGLVDWRESDTPFLPVAKIILPPQEFSSSAQQQFCDNLSFNPWHAIPEHRPLGNLNRSRRFVYRASAAARSRTETLEPTGNENFN